MDGVLALSGMHAVPLCCLVHTVVLIVTLYCLVGNKRCCDFEALYRSIGSVEGSLRHCVWPVRFFTLYVCVCVSDYHNILLRSVAVTPPDPEDLALIRFDVRLTNVAMYESHRCLLQ